MQSRRTDLAVEIKQSIEDVEGVREENEEKRGIKINRVYITSDEAAEKFGKEKGVYVTVDFDGAFGEDAIYSAAVEVIAEEIKTLGGADICPALVVGLGNDDLTSDALGPLTSDGLIVTRHLKTYAKNLYDNLRLGDVAAIIPGVLGKTGIESAEIVKAAAEKITPKTIIIIDALAARQMKRLCSTVQISNTGIRPGSGVGNARTELTKDSVGTPVISIGIPTVVDAFTLALDIVQNIGEEDCRRISAAMSPYEKNLIVTPKDIDSLVIKCAKLLSSSLNKVFHPYISEEEIRMLTEN